LILDAGHLPSVLARVVSLEGWRSVLVHGWTEVQTDEGRSAIGQLQVRETNVS